MDELRQGEAPLPESASKAMRTDSAENSKMLTRNSREDEEE